MQKTAAAAANANAVAVDDRILTTRELLERIPLDRSTIWRLCRDGRFPKPIQLTSSRIGWQWSAIVAWIDERKTNPLAARVANPIRRKKKTR